MDQGISGAMTTAVFSRWDAMASHLENTAVVIAPLIPWSIAGAVPLATVGAPTACILTACYLYLLPVWNYIAAIRNHHKK